MGLDNVAVRWPRLDRYYEPATGTEFTDFEEFAAKVATSDPPAAALAGHVARSGSVPAGHYCDLVDLLLGLDGVLAATDAAEEDEDPVIDPDGCAWIAGGLEKFVDAHRAERVTVESVAGTMRESLSGASMAEAQLRWLDARLAALSDGGEPPHWEYSANELAVLAAFYRRCADRGLAVFARH
jgi:hypothetical protein